MSVAVITGSSGLVGSETAIFLEQQGLDVVGIDNNLRRHFFGQDGSVAWNTKRLRSTLKHFRHIDMDIRNAEGVDGLFRELGCAVSLVVHCAAQPSHDWAARDPMMDFAVNATGTLVLLEACRRFCPEACFIFTSTNKVYGDAPNRLPWVEQATRWEIDPAHRFAQHGIDETMSIDQCTHSVFGASKVAADILSQEYGRYFGMNTGIFRGGCLTGPAHSGAELHGFLAYLVRCVVEEREYTIYGYKGKQVRDNLHSADLVNAFWQFFQNPRKGEVYNIGGSRHSSCSLLEAIELAETLCGKPLRWRLSETHRIGDHIWWISDVRKFQRHYPEWSYRYDIRQILKDLVEASLARHALGR